ncbi:ADP-ribosylglycohydrolase family protein [Kamptonema sp. UHCC 0994]|uniref:ADP-ribosylglycohydrolase family protein n=1 Tax=Kamptonema sp. UHCC 0994 TaxID=3031329 RepID=UPI0023B8F8D1|nr:ADP-ribosylglycohydrolase family protein [Kamptonema sp. UHCC 0994]MDF0551553.1 ADP-ribosylglycohydrolase family protein [Kamptonema sp. UHCC 0994]
MRYSLLSKFQGVLLGAALGELLGIEYQRQLSGYNHQNQGFNPSLNKIKLQNLLPGAVRSELKSVNLNRDFQLSRRSSSSSGYLAFLWGKSLMRMRGLDLKDLKETWVEFSNSESTKVNSQSDYQAIGTAPEEILQERKVVSPLAVHPSPFMLHPSEAAIATLPVAMFFHENKAKLREKLEQVAGVWQTPSQVEQDLAVGTLGVGYAIARALKEKLNPSTLISETLTYLGVDTPLGNLLVQVQILLEQNASLEAAQTQLYKSAVVKHKPEVPQRSLDLKFVSPSFFVPIAIAFYCFLSTPENLRLAVIRAARMGVEPQLTCSLVGALSGAYNSAVGIPVEWRVALGTNSEGSEISRRSPLIWGTVSIGEIMELAANLLAVWSGAYHSSVYSASPQPPVVAAPYVIRPQRV